MKSSGGDAGRRGRRAARDAKRLRRRRFWAGLVGGIVGWGLAGLDGGEAGTIEVPYLDVEFAAVGTYTSPEHGSVTFDLTANAWNVRQVVRVADEPIEMVLDRSKAKVRLLSQDEVKDMPMGYASASLFDPYYSVVTLVYPFAQVQHLADGPLEILREGIGSHLRHACERYRALGTVDGKLLEASACITVGGVPLLAEITSGGRTVRTELTELDFSPDPQRFTVPLNEDEGRGRDAASAREIIERADQGNDHEAGI